MAEEGGKVKRENVANAIAVLCSEMFESGEAFPSAFWAESFPTEVILYALLETQSKRRRTPGMIHRQIVNFANTVMERRLRDQQRRTAA